MSANKITRWNVHKLSPYEQASWRRGRKDEAIAVQQRNAALANGLASIRNNLVSETGNLVSRAAMDRMSRQRFSKLA